MLAFKFDDGEIFVSEEPLVCHPDLPDQAVEDATARTPSKRPRTSPSSPRVMKKPASMWDKMRSKAYRDARSSFERAAAEKGHKIDKSAMQKHIKKALATCRTKFEKMQK